MTAQSVDVLVSLIVFGAQITTQNPAKPEASALAVKRERIYAVGSDADILSLKDEHTRIIDAGGRRLIPGLNDAHIHVLNERNYNYNVRWEGVPTLSAHAGDAERAGPANPRWTLGEGHRWVVAVTNSGTPAPNGGRTQQGRAG